MYPFSFRKMNIHPISYCFPDKYILREPPKKEKFMANYALNNIKDSSTYIYNDEKEYLEDYQKSIFGFTKKKCGWDCYRHLEILSQGCFPYFLDIDKIPEHTMTHYPKEYIKEMMVKYGHRSFESIKKESQINLCYDIQQLLDYSMQHLSGSSMFRYMLNTSEQSDAKKILWNSDWNGYLSYNLISAGIQLFDSNFTDRYVEKHPYLFTDYSVEDAKKQYGRGFNYTRIIDSSKRRNVDNEEINQNIRNREYDCVVLGSCYQNNFNDIQHIYNYYDGNEIIYICENDCNPICDPDLGWTTTDNHICRPTFPLKHGGHFFIRELG